MSVTRNEIPGAPVFALPHVGVTSQEIAWCRANPEVPEAAALLDFYGRKYTSPHVVFRDQSALDAATAALRRLRPRPPLEIDGLYAWVNPRSKEGGEDVPGFAIDGQVTTMVGHDLARMWALDRYRPMLERGHGMPMTLYHFERGPDIPRGEIAQIYDPPGRALAPHSKVDTLFALITRFDSGDEGIGAYDNHEYGQTPLIFTRRASIAPMHVYLEMYYQAGKDVSFRSFVKRKRIQG